jgi:CRISPR-associated protein Csb2
VPTLKLRFPGGRYHATPWGHHVNEGLIEWPPSPWRLLRALIACGFSSQGWTEIPPIAQQLINKLAGVLPSYQLPEASAAHSRHFMPIGEFKKPKAKYRTDFQFSATTTQRADLYNHFTEDTTLVFDTWANVGDGTLLIHWPCELTDDETALAGRLARALGYRGRSESWVDAELVSDGQMRPDDVNAEPCQDGEHRGREWEQVSLIAPMPAAEYASWQLNRVAEVLKSFEGKKINASLRKKRDKAVEPYPPDLLSCLTKDTAWWKQHGWSQPPGSRRVLYWRHSDALEVSVPPPRKSTAAHPVTTMLLAITTASGSRSALPPVTRTLPQAELFHRAIVGRLANGNRVDCPELTGKDHDGRPRSDHNHAHTIPVDLDGDGHLDHIIVYASMGLRDAAQRAIRTMRKTWTKGGAGDLQVAVVGSGGLDMLRQLPPPICVEANRLLGPLDGALVWKSETPLVLPRFLKQRGRNTLHGQINAELASRGLPPAISVEFDAGLTRQLRHHVRRRRHSSVPPKVDIGFGVKLRFAEPVHGPLLLGYASHYGLGLFCVCDG